MMHDEQPSPIRSLRDYFAARAMQVFFKPSLQWEDKIELTPDERATECYRAADAMIEARKTQS